MHAQRPGAKALAFSGSLLQTPGRSRVTGQKDITAAVEVKEVVTLHRQGLQEVDAAVHEVDHGVVGPGPPIAVALRRFVTGQRHGLARVHEDDVRHTVFDGEVVRGGDPGDPRAADNHIGGVCAHIAPCPLMAGDGGSCSESDRG